MGRFTIPLVAACIALMVLIPPAPFPDRLVHITTPHSVDNAMYDELSWEPNSTQGGLYSLNSVRVPYFIAQWRSLHPSPAPAPSVLDLGCGGGIATLPLAQAGFRMTGVDMSQRSVQRARRAAAAADLNISFVRASAYQLPFADGAFDAVACFDVMEHLDNLRVFAAEAHRVLRPGGLVVFDTINRSWLSHVVAIQLLQRLLGEPPRGTHDWRLFVTPNETQRLYGDAGFEVGPRAQWRGIVPTGVRDWSAVLGDALRLRFRLANVRFGTSHDLSIGYLGWARKRAQR